LFKRTKKETPLVSCTETWEAKLSTVGQISEGDEDLTKLKADAWYELVTSKKIG